MTLFHITRHGYSEHNDFMFSPVNLDEELSPARWICDLNQEKATVWGEKFGSEGGESK